MRGAPKSPLPELKEKKEDSLSSPVKPPTPPEALQAIKAIFYSPPLPLVLEFMSELSKFLGHNPFRDTKVGGASSDRSDEQDPGQVSPRALLVAATRLLGHASLDAETSAGGSLSKFEESFMVSGFEVLISEALQVLDQKRMSAPDAVAGGLSASHEPDTEADMAAAQQFLHALRLWNTGLHEASAARLYIARSELWYNPQLSHGKVKDTCPTLPLSNTGT